MCCGMANNNCVLNATDGFVHICFQHMCLNFGGIVSASDLVRQGDHFNHKFSSGLLVTHD